MSQTAIEITKQMIEAGAKALVPFCYGAFEYQTDVNGKRVQPPLQPNDHASMASEAVLTAALSALAQGGVKGLEWVRREEFRGGELWTADHYYITYRQSYDGVDESFWRLEFATPFWEESKLTVPFLTLEAAKAAAQADYETRILSALSTTLQEPVGWLYEWPNGRKEFRSSDKPKDFDAWAATITPLYTSPTLAHQPVTAGWVVVPIEPTPEMETAARRYTQKFHDIGDSAWRRHMPADLFRLGWTAMLAALKSEGRNDG